MKFNSLSGIYVAEVPKIDTIVLRDCRLTGKFEFIKSRRTRYAKLAAKF